LDDFWGDTPTLVSWADGLNVEPLQKEQNVYSCCGTYDFSSNYSQNGKIEFRAIHRMVRVLPQHYLKWAKVLTAEVVSENPDKIKK